MADHPDYYLRATDHGGRLRVLAGRSTGLVEEARRRQSTSPVATAALGRTLTATALMGTTLKDDQTVTVRIDGGGPTGGIICVSNSEGRVRGYIQNPNAEMELIGPGKLNVGMAVGRKGSIYVTKDLGLKEPYTGSAPLVSGEIAIDFASYFTRSEQTPSAVGLGVLVDTDETVRAAGGIIVQLLPEKEADDEVYLKERLAGLEKNLASISSISHSIDLGVTPEDLISIVLQGIEYEVLERGELAYYCPCSREKARALLAGVGRDEIEDILKEGKGTELVCRFCGERYNFEHDEVQVIHGEMGTDSGGGKGQVVH